MDTVNLALIQELPQDELVRAFNVLKGELAQRASIEGLERISNSNELASKLYYSSNLKLAPYVEDGLVYCPGIKTSRSALSHKCTFISVSNKWCWEDESKLSDEMIFTQNDSGKTVNSLTILPLTEGLVLDVVSCKASGSAHKVISVRTYEIIDGNLISIKSRNINFSTHR